ncbi:hypothetical protein BSKO_03539 [Bryopsis sp. KO-2023]|nr:hypothetical protein BSKO_03539 [Bryopsis sp. KO-2023]
MTPSNKTSLRPRSLRLLFRPVRAAKRRQNAISGGGGLKRTLVTRFPANSRPNVSTSASGDGSRKSPAQEALVDYDPVSLQNDFASRPWLVAARFGEVIAAFSGLAASTGWPLKDAKSLDKVKLGKDLCAVFTSLGPTFVKLGQTLATRPDVMGEEVALELENLQTDTPPFANLTALAVIEEEFGEAVNTIFSFLSEDPVASASLGQVYFGIVAGTGKKVAIKVQRPGMYDSIGLDIYVLRLALGLVRSLASINQDIRLVADEVGQGLIGELDYQQEAQQSDEFRTAHAHLGFVDVPEIVHHLTTKRILTMNWVDGLTPTNYLSHIEGLEPKSNISYNEASLAALKALSPQEARSQLLGLIQMGVECSLSQLLETGVMHADPHPGNIMRSSKGAIVYLDFGLITRVPPASSQAMMGGLVHIVLGDWLAVVDDLEGMGLLKTAIDREALAQDLEKEFVRMTGPSDSDNPFEVEGASNGKKKSPLVLLLGSSSTKLTFGAVSKVMLKLAVKYRFKLPPYYTLIVRSLATLEGLALKADPGFKIVRSAFPIVVRRLLCDSRPGARALLRELLLDADLTLKLDWLGDLVDLWNKKKLTSEESETSDSTVAAASKPATTSKAKPAMQSASKPVGDIQISESVIQSLPYLSMNGAYSNGNGANGAASSNGAHCGEVLPEELNGNGSSVQPELVVNSDAVLSNGAGPSFDTVDRLPSEATANRRNPMMGEEEPSSSGDDLAETLGGGLGKSDFLEMLLSRNAAGLRRIFVECSVVGLVKKLRGPDGERWRLLFAVVLAGLVKKGCRGIWQFPKKALLVLGRLLNVRRKNLRLQHGELPFVYRRRLKVLIGANFRKLRKAGVAVWFAFGILAVRIAWMALGVLMNRKRITSRVAGIGS